MKKIIILSALFLSLNVIAQNKFQKGYFVTQEGAKVNCLIKNMGWQYAPNQLSYKSSKESKTHVINTNQLVEFEIDSKIRYERHNVKFDRSSDDLKKLTNNRVSIFEEENVLLKVLIKGKTSLYAHLTGNLSRYFYQNESSDIQVLEYKKYITSINTIRENLNYKKQIKDNFKCGNATTKDVKYREKELANYFSKYYKCIGDKNYVNYFENSYEKAKINIAVKAGISNVILLKENSLHYKLGAELEYLFNFGNKKWSIFIEPTYQSYISPNNEKIIIGYEPIIIPSLGYTTYRPIYTTEENKYSSIEVPLGIRHYFFLKNNHKLFANTGLIKEFNLKLNDQISDTSYSDINYFLGIGYNINNKYSLEFRYNSPRKILQEKNLELAEIKIMSLKFGYYF